MEINKADVAELVDARDLKSLDGNVVRVRVPPPAPRMGSVKTRIGGTTGANNTPNSIFQRLVPALADVPGVNAIVLGGSRARGTATENSDYDLGLYYSAAKQDRKSVV